MKTTIEAYQRAVADITCVGISTNGWIGIGRAPSGHFEVDIEEDDFEDTTEGELCEEIESAIFSVLEDYKRQWNEIRSEHVDGGFQVIDKGEST